MNINLPSNLNFFLSFPELNFTMSMTILFQVGFNVIFLTLLVYTLVQSPLSNCLDITK